MAHKKKRKKARDNDYFDNYSKKIGDSFIGGLVMGGIVFIIYIITSIFF